MICCSSLRLLAVVAAARAPADTAPPAFASRVRAAVAERWHVDSSQLQLQWERLPTDSNGIFDAPLRITGQGTDGWLIAVLEPPRGMARAVRFRAGVLRSLAVAAHPLRAGQTIGADDLEMHDEVVWSINAPLVATPAAGWEIRRDIAAGAILTSAVVVPPRVIAAGDAVVFTWVSNGLRIEREARAESSARVGEAVQGRAGSARLTGTATGPGTARLAEVVR
ncbi:MAG TPA: flagellar basal body P-ring formation chaperone FlgA [Gemmatimonadales bacterium]